METFQQQLARKENEIRDLKGQIRKLSFEDADTVKEKDDLQDPRDHLEHAYNELREERDNLLNENRAFRDAINNVREERDDLAAQLAKLKLNTTQGQTQAHLQAETINQTNFHVYGGGSAPISSGIMAPTSRGTGRLWQTELPFHQKRPIGR